MEMQKKLAVEPKAVAQLKTLVKKLDDFCFEHNIPYFFSAAINDTGKKTGYFSNTRSAIAMGIQLQDNYFENYLKVLNGCEVVFPETLPEVSFQDIIPESTTQD